MTVGAVHVNPTFPELTCSPLLSFTDTLLSSPTSADDARTPGNTVTPSE